MTVMISTQTGGNFDAWIFWIVDMAEPLKFLNACNSLNSQIGAERKTW
jgi:hypothetical protein